MESWRSDCPKTSRENDQAGPETRTVCWLQEAEALIMVINIEENDLKHGLLGLVIALVEIIKEALKLQAVKRMEGGDLTESEVDRLGMALMDLDTALEQIKEDQGVAESVAAVRDGLDGIVDDLLEKFLNPSSLLGDTCPDRNE